ncbi:MAG: transporter substrate-binding domain-containing protein [Candidatus Omnitrophota bacterium]
MKIRKCLYWFILTTLVSTFSLGLLPTSQVKSQDEPLVFAGHNEFAPYSFYSDGAPSGYMVDLTRILSVTIGKDIDIKLMPWGKCIAELKAGNVDGLIGVPVYREREKYMDYSAPVAEVEYAIFVEKKNTYVTSLKSLEGTLVGVHKESLIIDTLAKNPNITLVQTETFIEALKKLENREIAAVVAEKNVMRYYIHQQNIKDLKIAGPPIGPVYAYSLAVGEGKTELLKSINSGIEILEENETLQKLQRKWFGLRLEQIFPWKMVIFVTTGITGTMFALLVVLWVVSLNATIKSKTQQIKLMSERMVEKDKLAVLGKLAGQIAHELRTPLSIINNSVYLIRKEGSQNQDLFEKRLHILEDKIKLSSNILESILSYSRVKAEVSTDILIKECLDEVLKDLEIPKGTKSDVIIKKAESLMVYMDFHQLYSVVRNLVLNSIQAMGEKGTLTVEAFPSDNGATVNIRVCDTGKGIMESAKNKVFNLFYSTKITGTGLGLPISKSIVEANQGQLLLEETSEKGSCFIIKLPSSKSLKK